MPVVLTLLANFLQKALQNCVLGCHQTGGTRIPGHCTAEETAFFAIN